MDTVYIPFVVVLAGVVGALVGRLAHRRTGSRETQAQDWQLTEYVSGTSRSYYDVFEGRHLDQHEQAHLEQVQLARGVELAAQRQTGRLEGRQVVIRWTPGVDQDADINARWLQEHGASVGVVVRRK